MDPQRQRFPLVEPSAIHHLAVSPLHTLYIEEIGTPQGMPVVFLHGGPGIGTLPHYRQLFDPEKFHVFLYSQRGAYPSTPVGELHENDTWQLVEDLEKIRRYFGIEQWVVFGGSWGCTLGLAYALKHKEAVSALILRGLMLGSQRESDWVYKEGVSRFFPEEWQNFNALIPEAERGDLVVAYHARIFDPDPRVHLAAAQAWIRWEEKLTRLLPGEAVPLPDVTVLSMARIENHYEFNRFFLPEDGYLFNHIHELATIPFHIVQGRYDMLCPFESAYRLAARLPQVKIHLVPGAGHSASEPGVTSELIGALDEVYNTLNDKG